jgi:abequosyltransferase
MSTRHNLSIVIPTYNRADFLDILLEKHVNIFRQCDIPIFIYNNASTDDTNEVINKWKGKWRYHLTTSETNIDNIVIFDKSVENTLKLLNKVSLLKG